jgi:hypothetical protein
MLHTGSVIISRDSAWVADDFASGGMTGVTVKSWLTYLPVRHIKQPNVQRQDLPLQDLYFSPYRSARPADLPCYPI